jgi:hypothetical protein
MLSWSRIILSVLLACLVNTLAHNNKDPFMITGQEMHTIEYKLERAMRITFLQFHGHAFLKISSAGVSLYASS